MYKLFTYGSLMCDDIMHHVAGNCTTVGNATLENYRCLAVKGEEYPAIVKRDGNITHGVLYDAISPKGFEQLDEFEGDMYQRLIVRVTLDSGQRIDAYAYVICSEFEHLLTDMAWRFDEFLKNGKGAFIRKYVGFSKIE